VGELDLDIKDDEEKAVDSRIYAEEVYQDYLHVLLMGRPGAGKSHFAATFPKPMLVFGFDPAGKEDPYLDRGTAGPITEAKSKNGLYSFAYRDIYSKKEKGRVIIRYEYWGESNPIKPDRYPTFMARTMALEQEIRESGWKTIVLDSATYFELTARAFSENGVNRLNDKGEVTKDQRIHYGYSAHACEQYLMMRLPNLIMCNTIAITHIDEQKDYSSGAEDGAVVRKMAALPGKLPNRIAGGYGECWLIYRPNPAGKERLLQTQEREGSMFDCKSLKRFPDPCPAHYELLWKGRSKEL